MQELRYILHRFDSFSKKDNWRKMVKFLACLICDEN